MKSSVVLKLACWNWVMCLGLLADAASKPLPAEPLASGNKYLFVVDISASMKKLALPSRQAVFDLIYTGLYGQMRAGDTYGLWTFSDQTHTGIYPMQAWDPDQTMDQASRAAKFLRASKFGGRTQVESLMNSLAAVVRVVEDVHVFIISDDRTHIKGTPFDQDLEIGYLQNADRHEQEQQPFITTLATSRGEIVSASVQLATDPILLIKPVEPPAMANTTTAGKASNQVAIAKSAMPDSTTDEAQNQRSSTTPVETSDATKAQSTPRRKRESIIISSRTIKKDLLTDLSGSPASEAATQSANLQSDIGRPSTRSALVRHPSGAAAKIDEAPAKEPDRLEHPVSKPLALSNSLPAETQRPTRLAQNRNTAGSPLTVAAREKPDSPASSSTPAVTLGMGGMPMPPSMKVGVLLVIGGGIFGLAMILVLVSLKRIRSSQQSASYISQSMAREGIQSSSRSDLKLKV